MAKLPEYHVLTFAHDNDNGCALTALVGEAWYHVTVDRAQFQDRSKKGKRIAREYQRLLGQVKAAEQKDSNETAPLFVQEDEDEDGSEDEDQDSAVDVSTPVDDEAKSDEKPSEPSDALARWILRPLRDSFNKNKSQDHASERSVQDWYHCPKHYFHLTTTDSKLTAEEEEVSSSSKIAKRVDALLPRINLPKYIQEMKVPMIDASEVVVLKENEEPAPIHPARVRYDEKEYFLKTVDTGQPQPTKREIQVMKQIESEGLHHELRVPLLQGLVHFSDEHKNKPVIMGLLMDAIDEPQPLTLLIDSDIPQEKRNKWAEESAKMVDVLHQHGIIWGDAKGDNFMVDKNDDLWIIDFGGSYTEGWVDPELKETEEGDDMGVRKIYNGLQNPEENTIQPDEEEAVTEKDFEEGEKENENEHDGNTTQGADESKAGRKRKSDDTEGLEETDEDEHQRQPKRPRTQSETEHPEPRYCYCNGPGSGSMVACDGEKCKREWFHFACVGIDEAPSQKKWYCKDCRSA